MHDRPHLSMSPAEAASLRASSPVDEALLQRIRAALVGKDRAGEASDTEQDDPRDRATVAPETDPGTERETDSGTSGTDSGTGEPTAQAGAQPSVQPHHAAAAPTDEDGDAPE